MESPAAVFNDTEVALLSRACATSLTEGNPSTPVFIPPSGVVGVDALRKRKYRDQLKQPEPESVGRLDPHLSAPDGPYRPMEVGDTFTELKSFQGKANEDACHNGGRQLRAITKPTKCRMACRSTGCGNEFVASRTRQTKGLWEVKQAPHCVKCQLLPEDRRKRGIMVNMLPSGVVEAVMKSVCTMEGTSKVQQVIDNVFRQSGTLLSYQQARSIMLGPQYREIAGFFKEFMHQVQLLPAFIAELQKQSTTAVYKLFLNGGAPQMGASLATAGVENDLYSFAGPYVCLETTLGFQAASPVNNVAVDYTHLLGVKSCMHGGMYVYAQLNANKKSINLAVMLSPSNEDKKGSTVHFCIDMVSLSPLSLSLSPLSRYLSIYLSCMPPNLAIPNRASLNVQA